MDGYLGKAGALADLKAALEPWLPAVAEPAPEASESPALALDTRVLKDLVGDDLAVIDELL